MISNLLKAKVKIWLDANVWDGEDRSGTKDTATHNPDDLQELVEDLLVDLLNPLASVNTIKNVHFDGHTSKLSEVLTVQGTNGATLTIRTVEPDPDFKPNHEII